jgi:hypothetical protein
MFSSSFHGCAMLGSLGVVARHLIRNRMYNILGHYHTGREIQSSEERKREAEIISTYHTKVGGGKHLHFFWYGNSCLAAVG